MKVEIDIDNIVPNLDKTSLDEFITKDKDKNKYNVILDTDTYNEADDQFALSYLLKSQEIFNIEAITIAPFKHSKWQKTVSESIDASYNEACKIFDLLDFIEAVKVVFESKVRLTILPCSPITSNLMTSIYELESELKGKNKLCDYLCYRFYNRSHGPTKRWPLWDISVIAYMINKNWFNTIDISCPLINNDNTFKFTKNRHNIKFVNYLNANEIFKDLFEKLTSDNI